MSGQPELEGFRPPSSAGTKVGMLVIGFTLAVTLAIVLILPITQYLGGDPRERYVLREFDFSMEPPPPVEEEPPPPEEEEEEQEVEELEEPPPLMDLTQLEALLNPGTGGALNVAGNVGAFGVTTKETVADIQYFALNELDEKPKRRRVIDPQSLFGFTLKRELRGTTVRAKVEVEIDETGQARVVQVIETSDARVVKPITDAVNQWTYTPPKKDGKKVRARYIQPFTFEL